MRAYVHVYMVTGCSPLPQLSHSISPSSFRSLIPLHPHFTVHLSLLFLISLISSLLSPPHLSPLFLSSPHPFITTPTSSSSLTPSLSAPLLSLPHPITLIPLPPHFFILRTRGGYLRIQRKGTQTAEENSAVTPSPYPYPLTPLTLSPLHPLILPLPHPENQRWLLQDTDGEKEHKCRSRGKQRSNICSSYCH